MAKVKAKLSFVGTPEEMGKYAGQVSTAMKPLEHRMTDQEKLSYGGKINPGTEMEVSDKRAEELLKLGLIEGEQPKEEKPKEKAEVMTMGNVKEKKTDLSVTGKAKKK